LTYTHQTDLAVPTRDRINLLGIDIDNVTFHETLNKIERLIENRKPSFIVTPNVDHLITLQEDADFREIYKRADLAVPDGAPLLWAAFFLRTPLKERVPGSDLFPAICEIAAQKGYKVFFLGGLPGVTERAKSALVERCPGINVVGTYSPPFGFEHDPAEKEKIWARIKKSKPDILFVGLGAPKQEKFIWQSLDIVKVPVSMGIGIAFDFMAGTIPRAPRVMQKVGMEWLFRLFLEPRRLFKRYILRDMKFFKLVYLQKMRLKRSLRQEWHEARRDCGSGLG
jgi:N-acetylglucosaminyldiphosphoundecaprenol N-acetyl-beta-D-mannosaminyltransferase